MSRFMSLTLGLSAIVFSTSAADAAKLIYGFEDPVANPVVNTGTGGSTFDGTLIFNAAYDSTTSKVGSNSLLLDGTDDAVTIGSNIALINSADAVTLAAWIRPTDATRTGLNQTIIHISNSAGVGSARALLRVTPEGKVQAGGRADTETSFQSQTTSAALTDNTWVHVTAVIDYIAGGGTVDVYFDGVLQADSGTLSFSGNSTAVTNSLIARVGSDGSATPAAEFFGWLDDVRVYDRALSSNEIAALVPEPAALSLLGLAVLPLMRRRRV